MCKSIIKITATIIDWGLLCILFCCMQMVLMGIWHFNYLLKYAVIEVKKYMSYLTFMRLHPSKTVNSNGEEMKT